MPLASRQKPNQGHDPLHPPVIMHNPRRLVGPGRSHSELLSGAPIAFQPQIIEFHHFFVSCLLRPSDPYAHSHLLLRPMSPSLACRGERERLPPPPSRALRPRAPPVALVSEPMEAAQTAPTPMEAAAADGVGWCSDLSSKGRTLARYVPGRERGCTDRAMEASCIAPLDEGPV